MSSQCLKSNEAPSLQVNLGLLDTLMNLAGELVLSRNQLVQSVGAGTGEITERSCQHIDMITSELQEAIMRTRLQPVGPVLDKLDRAARDLSGRLGKSIHVTLKGREVEMDKAVLESIDIPLIQLVQNAVAHGIETPEERQRLEKNTTGNITVKAFHDAGQVNIVVSDDGRGLDPDKIGDTAVAKGLIRSDQLAGMTKRQKMELILLPGFSTAPKGSHVSGSNAGMDVVTAQVKTLGGTVEIDSTPLEGTQLAVKLPLTLSIIPSLITRVGDNRFAIPQVNLNELLRIPASEIKTRVERVGNGEVIRLRGDLLPLLNLSDLLDIPRTYTVAGKGEKLPERRKNIADRRSENSLTREVATDLPGKERTKAYQIRTGGDRRKNAGSAVNIAIVSAGFMTYGLVVDQFYDSEEIVVKPMGRHLNSCAAYSGATIMGDGRVALILDILNIAQVAGLSASFDAAQKVKAAEVIHEPSHNKSSLLLFQNSENEFFAAPLDRVSRIERIPSAEVECIGDKRVVQYRNGALPLYEMSALGAFKPLPEREHLEVVVFKAQGKELGLTVLPPVDVFEADVQLDQKTFQQKAIQGAMTIKGRTTLFVDLHEFAEVAGG